MALIPRGQQTVRMQVTSPVSAVPTNGDRSMQALAQFGDTVERVGRGLLENQRRVQIARGTDALNEATRVSLAEAQQRAQADGSDLAKVYDDLAGPRIAEVQSQFGSDPVVGDELQRYNERVGKQIGTDLTIKRFQMLEKSNYDGLQEIGDRAAERLRQNPNEDLATAEMKNYGATLDQMVQSGGMSAENALKARQEYSSKAALSLISGLEEKNQLGKALTFLQATADNTSTDLDPAQARALGFIDSREASALEAKGETFKVANFTKGDKVKLNPEIAVLMQSLTPRQKEQLTDNLKAKMRENTQIRMGDLNAQINGFQAFAAAGGDYTEKDVAALKAQINSVPHLTKQARVRLMDEVNTADVLNKQVKLMQITPRSQWGKILETADVKIAGASLGDPDPAMQAAGKDFAVAGNRAKAKERLLTTMQIVAKQQNEDPAAFVQKDPQLQMLYRGTKDDDPAATANYLRQSFAKQNYLGIPPDNVRALSKSEAIDYGMQLKYQTSSGEMNTYMAGLQRKYGEYFPKVMQEISATDPTLKGTESAVYAPPEIRGQILDVLKNRPVINEAFSKLPRMTYKQDLINQNIRSEVLSDLNRAVMDSSDGAQGQGVVNTLQELVELKVKSDLNYDPSQDVKTLVQKAKADIIDRQYSIVSAVNSSILMPKQINGIPLSEQAVENFATDFSSQEGLKKLSLATPKSFEANGQGDAWLGYVEERGRWVTNADQTGIKLVVIQPNGSKVQVYNKYGKPVERSFQRIMTYGGE